jgi:hypothetical protein
MSYTFQVLKIRISRHIAHRQISETHQYQSESFIPLKKKFN